MPPIESAVRRALADGHPDEAAAILRAAPDPPPIRTPFGLAPDDDPPSLDDRRLMALCGDMGLLEAELGRAIAQIDALRRRVAALERRRPRRGLR